MMLMAMMMMKHYLTIAALLSPGPCTAASLSCRAWQSQ